MKRSFDIVIAVIASVLLLPLLLLAVLLATIDTGQLGIFRQIRVGRFGQVFEVYKIRTMRNSKHSNTTVTTRDDPRITKLGGMLRRSKIDELPQLFNVILGDMSLVGPRPDVPGFADCLEGNDRVVLSVRPGITGPASLHFRDEESLLATCDNPELYNREILYPAKVKINRAYIESYSLLSDFKIIWSTVVGGSPNNMALEGKSINEKS